jgi:regulator of cell morphogenesis and NO signaling
LIVSARAFLLRKYINILLVKKNKRHKGVTWVTDLSLPVNLSLCQNKYEGMKTLKNQTVGSIVAEHFNTAAVFKSVGIDFCCGGHQSLEAAAVEQGVNLDTLEQQLNETIESGTGGLPDFKDWSLDFLADYIVNVYHSKAWKMLPEIKAYVDKIAHVHGENHPELHEIADAFNLIHTEMPLHLKEEEDSLFPAIKLAMTTNDAAAKATIKAAYDNLMNDHVLIGGTMDNIRELSNKYALPEDACNTYLVTYKLLEAFEDDLHIHVHLENNLLFPRAMALS